MYWNISNIQVQNWWRCFAICLCFLSLADIDVFILFYFILFCLWWSTHAEYFYEGVVTKPGIDNTYGFAQSPLFQVPHLQVIFIWIGPVRICHSIQEIATQPAILWIELGVKPKWLQLKFGYNEAMRTAPVRFIWWSPWGVKLEVTFFKQTYLYIFFFFFLLVLQVERSSGNQKPHRFSLVMCVCLHSPLVASAVELRSNLWTHMHTITLARDEIFCSDLSKIIGGCVCGGGGGGGGVPSDKESILVASTRSQDLGEPKCTLVVALPIWCSCTIMCLIACIAVLWPCYLRCYLLMHSMCRGRRGGGVIGK